MRVKGTPLHGTVVRINGAGSERRFVLDVGAAAKPVSRTVYWLEELEPRMPLDDVSWQPPEGI